MADRQDIVNLALRNLNVISLGERASGDQFTYGKTVLDALFAEFGLDATISWDLDTVPTVAEFALADLLASELAIHYGVQYKPRSRAWGRLRAIVKADDRTDSRDLDGDGVVSEDEIEAAKRAEYF